MDGLSRIIGAPIDVTLSGRNYWLKPLTLRCLGICEFHLLAQRRTPLETVADGLEHLPTDMAREFLRRGFMDTFRDQRHQMVSRSELFTWLGTIEGIAFSLRLCLRTETFRRMTERRIARIIHTADQDELLELRRRRDLASGIDLASRIEWADDDEDDETVSEWRKMRGLPEPPKRPGPASIPWKRLMANFLGTGKESFCPFAGTDAAAMGRWTIPQLYVYLSDPDSLKVRGGVSAITFTAGMSRDEIDHMLAVTQSQMIGRAKALRKQADQFVASVLGEDGDGS